MIIILASRITGVWQNQTIASGLVNSAQGHHFDMDIDSQDQIHVTYTGKWNSGKYVYHGVLSSIDPSSSWDITELTTIGFWPALAVDSNDNVHLSYHGGVLQKINGTKLTPLGLGVRELKRAPPLATLRGYFNEMTMDSNDDVIITAHGQLLVAQIVTLE